MHVITQRKKPESWCSTRFISDQIALHSVQLLFLIIDYFFGDKVVADRHSVFDL